MIKKCIAGTAALLVSMFLNGISTAMADVQLNEVVVTATKTERSPQDVTQSVTVITSKEIEKSGATNVAEVIATTAGATVTDQGPLGSLQAVTLRGSTYQQVLVLLDGMRLNSGSAGGYDLSELPVPLDSIERIEIVRGPASALYGADAVGGVVNIITKKPTKPVTTLSGDLGAHVDTKENAKRPVSTHVSLYNTGRDRNTYYALSYSKDHSNGYRINSDVDQYNAGFKLGHDFDTASSIEASVDYVTKNIGVPGSVQFPSPVARQQNREIVTGVQYKQRLSKAVDVNIRAYQNDEKLNYENPDPLFAEFSRNRSTTSGGEVQLNWLMNSFSVVTVGAEGRDDSMAVTEVLVDNVEHRHTASLWSTYIQDEMSLGDSFILVVGGRNDIHSTFGSEWSPKTSARYLNARSGTILRASYGKSFRAPTLNDLYFKDAFGNVGNPDLQPESAEEYEGGIEQPFSKGNSIKFTAFRRRVKDLIEWVVPDPVNNPFAYSPANVGRARVSGTETELHFAFQSLSGSMSYTLMFPVNESTGERLFSDVSHIPAQQLAGTLQIALDAQTVLSLDGRSVRNYVRPGDPKWNYDTLDGKITDTIVSDKSSKTEVFIGMKNIFNRRYETVKGYPMPPQVLYGGITATF
jgi:vitamin B12 transporter